MWAPSPVADVVSREMPVEMEQPDIDELVDGFAASSRQAVGVGARRRGDRCRLLLAPAPVPLGAHQSAIGCLRVRSSPPDHRRAERRPVRPRSRRCAVAPALLRRARPVGRGDARPGAGTTSPSWPGWSTSSWWSAADRTRPRPTAPTATPRPPSTSGCAARCARRRPVGPPSSCRAASSTPAVADSAVDDGTADLVEMTRAQIAEPRLVVLVRGGDGARVRPCILCNQACHVRDNRNPVVSCVGEPRSGHETLEPPVDGTDAVEREVLIVGAGVAGLECARVLVGAGAPRPGGGAVRPHRRRPAGRGGGPRTRAPRRAGRVAGGRVPRPGGR